MTTSIPPKQTRPGRDFIRLDEMARSAITGLYKGDITQYLAVTKFSIQKFIENCLAQKGLFRTFFRRFATFTGDFVVNMNLSKDVDKRGEELSDHFNPDRHIQVATWYDDLRERPPTIFIQDGGYSYGPSGLGGLSAGENLVDGLGSQMVRVTDEVEIPIEITCAAMDEQLVEDLAAFMSMAFGSLGQRFTVGYYLEPPRNDMGLAWQVRIPLTHNMSAKSHTPMKGDPRVQIWQVSCSMSVMFENSTDITYRADPRYILSQRSTQIAFPSKIMLGRLVPVTIKLSPKPVNIVSSDSRIAVVFRDKTTFYVKPRRIGHFTLQVFKNTSHRDSDLITSQEVEVVLR